MLHGFRKVKFSMMDLACLVLNVFSIGTHDVQSEDWDALLQLRDIVVTSAGNIRGIIIRNNLRF
jgi:hypothetical protein